MANWIIAQTVDLAKGINADAFRREIYPLAYPGDDNSHVWQVTITNNGVPFVLQHHTVVSYFFREYDQQTVMAVGQVSGNVASVALPEQVYAYQCRIQAIMRVNYSGTNTTVAAMSFRVGENITGTIIDPGEAIPGIDDLLNEIERLEAATAAAETAATKSVRYNEAQSLTDAQKTQARENIDAASVSDIYNSKRTTIDLEIIDDWVSGFYRLNGSPTHVDISNVIANDTFVCMAISVTPGDVYRYSGKCDAAPRMYAFLSADETNNVISIGSYSSEPYTDFVIFVPNGAAYMLVNAYANQPHCLIGVLNEKYILPNTDLNNLLTPGTYFCQDAATANTLGNLPDGVANSFRMYVERTRLKGAYCAQTLITNTIRLGSQYIYQRNVTDTTDDWRCIWKGEQNPLDIQYLKMIPDNTDLDDIVEYGSYYCSSGTHAATLLNLPFLLDTGFSLYVINSSSSATTETYIRQFIFANKKTFSSVYTRTKNIEWGEWQLLSSARMIASPNIISDTSFTPAARLSGEPKKTIRVATNNVAHYWLQGKPVDDYLSDHPFKILNWRKVLMKADADILFLQECEDYIDSERTRSAFNSLYKPFFDSDHNIDDQGAMRPDKSGSDHPSRRKILNRLGLNTEAVAVAVESLDPTYTKRYYFNWCINRLTDVGDILFINIHNFPGKSADRVADRSNYLGVLAEFISTKTYDYMIIAGDTNIVVEDDYTNLLSFCERINATPVNGGILGWFGTHNQEEVPHSYDNIIVSNNIRIENIDCDPTAVPSGLLHTDHSLVLATISFV